MRAEIQSLLEVPPGPVSQQGLNLSMSPRGANSIETIAGPSKSLCCRLPSALQAWPPNHSFPGVTTQNAS